MDLGRIIEIVNALKSYSYLDQAPIQSVDVHDGLNDTLIMLGSKLKRVSKFDGSMRMVCLVSKRMGVS